MNHRLAAVFVGGLLLFAGVRATDSLLPTEEEKEPAPVAAEMPSSAGKAYKELVQEWGSSCPELTPALLAAQINQESGWNPQARSSAGAQGIAQFIPGTWAVHGIDANQDGKRDVWDPEDAIPSAAKYDCLLAEKARGKGGNTTKRMLAAYNSGSNQLPPKYEETRNYIKVITAASGNYEEWNT